MDYAYNPNRNYKYLHPKASSIAIKTDEEKSLKRSIVNDYSDSHYKAVAAKPTGSEGHKIG